MTGDFAVLTMDDVKATSLTTLDFVTSPEIEARRLCGNASALFDAGDYAGAEVLFEQAHAVAPDYAGAAKNLSVIYLMRGEFAKAWPLFLARFATDSRAVSLMPETNDSDLRIWDGSYTRGKVLLIWGEQGLGDQILFASMLRDLNSKGIVCALVCEHRLVPLFARSFPWLVVVPADSVAMPQYGYQILMGELCQYFRKTREQFHGAKSWLKASPVKAAGFRKRNTDGRRVVGVSWHSARAEDGAQKSVPLAMVQSLVSTHGDDVRWVNLQHGPERARLSGAVIDGDTTNDIDGLAAQLTALDLFITVSNTTAHLAAALGVTTWLLEPRGRGARWYWGTSETPSPWYPYVQVFHQTTPGDWSTVMANVSEALDGW